MTMPHAIIYDIEYFFNGKKMMMMANIRFSLYVFFMFHFFVGISRAIDLCVCLDQMLFQRKSK